MGVYYGGNFATVAQAKGSTGWYNIGQNGVYATVFIDQDYDGGGWVCVLANRGYTGGMNNLKYHDAVYNCNFRTGGSNNGSNIVVPSSSKLGTLDNYNIWVGVDWWSSLSGRVTSGKTTIVQFVSDTNGTKLGATGSHNRRYRWRSDGFTTGYAFTGATGISDETGTGAPGLLNYHAVNSFPLQTGENQNLGGCNCSPVYNNNPWWYGCCWSGNYFAGNGYLDRPYWESSGGDNWQYGAVYIK
jgi:hypothetical protein